MQFVREASTPGHRAGGCPCSTNSIRRVADFFGLLNSPLYYPALAGIGQAEIQTGCWHNVIFDGPPHLGSDPLRRTYRSPGII